MLLDNVRLLISYLRHPCLVCAHQSHTWSGDLFGLWEFIEPRGLRNEEEIDWAVNFLVVTPEFANLFCKGLVLAIIEEKFCIGDECNPLRLEIQNQKECGS